MPTYDYRCKGCDHLFEHFQSISDPLLKKCPACGKNRLERLIGAGAGILFKGSGFYSTDYRSSAYTEAAKKDTAPTAGGGGDNKSAKGDTPKGDAGSTASGPTAAGSTADAKDRKSESRPASTTPPPAAPAKSPATRSSDAPPAKTGSSSKRRRD
ncbi:MAG: zinc ribbon domain-containing protein [Planctomycetes bacterium]|nr:zinc ribbon domain-containing protein [Planctomycetota bacterium]